MRHNKLLCDYIYLDTDERRRFAQVSHEYLIEQVQEQTVLRPDVLILTLIIRLKNYMDGDAAIVP